MKIKIPFIGQSYQARSSNVDAQRTLNCFVELDESNGRAPLALYGTPGLRKVLTLPTYPVRGGIAVRSLAAAMLPCCIPSRNLGLGFPCPRGRDSSC